jgi:predicted TIM-barrel fold metal-dependent hydrolase
MAQGAPQSIAHRIDIHHHILPPFYLQEVGKEIRATAPGFPQLFDWTPEKTLADMDTHSVATAVLSMSTPGIWFGDRDQARSLARRCNEYAVKMRADHPGRFGLFAALPLPDVEGSLLEIDYALGTLKADGIGLLTSYGNSWLGDEAYAPVFDELNRRKAVAYFHPTAPGFCTGLLPEIPPPMVEFPFDTTRAILTLLFSGTFTRCPDVRFIFSHAGGALPMLAHRIAAVAATRKELAEQMPKGAMHEFGRLFYDVVNASNPISFNAIRQLAGISQLLYGSDFPFWSPQLTADALAKLGLTPGEMRAVERDNALRLLPRLKP